MPVVEEIFNRQGCDPKKQSVKKAVESRHAGKNIQTASTAAAS